MIDECTTRPFKVRRRTAKRACHGRPAKVRPSPWENGDPYEGASNAEVGAAPRGRASHGAAQDYVGGVGLKADGGEQPVSGGQDIEVAWGRRARRLVTSAGPDGCR